MHEFSNLQNRAMNQVTNGLVVHVHQLAYFVVRHFFYIAIIDHFVLLGDKTCKSFFTRATLLLAVSFFRNWSSTEYSV